MLAAVKRFFVFLGRSDCRVKPLRIQRRPFQDRNRELSRAEYDRLLAAAYARGQERLALLEAVCATGIHVSEVRCLTVEAAHQARADGLFEG